MCPRSVNKNPTEFAHLEVAKQTARIGREDRFHFSRVFERVQFARAD